nr:beta-defensin 133 [Cavia porcellus]
MSDNTTTPRKHFVSSQCPSFCSYICFVKSGKCSHACHNAEYRVGFCKKLNARCCM